MSSQNPTQQIQTQSKESVEDITLPSPLLNRYLELTNTSIQKNISTILETRYLQKDENGKSIENQDGLFWRVAGHIAKIEETEEKRTKLEKLFYKIMTHNLFLPNSPTLMNAGTGRGTLSACFVLPLEDTMDGILDTAKAQGMTLKYGGGTGFNLSKIRPEGSSIATTHGKSCGPIRTLKHLNSVSKLITQGGKRDGANMAILSVRHPDVLNFIQCKNENAGASKDEQSISEFNISVSVDDDFMKAAKDGKSIDLIWNGKVINTISASYLLEEICKSAWATGDPGLFFRDSVNRDNSTPHLGSLECTNPCGEVPLYPNEACNLGSINLSVFYDEKQDDVDWNNLRNVVRLATRFLDNVVTVNEYPSKEIRNQVMKTRKIGLGVMGWADLLMLMKIPYDSEDALWLADSIMAFINYEAKQESIEIAKEKGPYEECREEVPVRNATRTCIAPTGTIARIANASSGIEPIFGLSFISKVLNGEQLVDVSQVVKRTLFNMGYFRDELRKGEYSSPDLTKIIELGSAASIESLSDKVKEVLKVANEIPAETHIKHQAAFQTHTDLAVSKTINMHNSTTVDKVLNSYLLAWELGCKGITIYRDGSRQFQVLNQGTKEREVEEKSKEKNIERSIEDNKPSKEQAKMNGGKKLKSSKKFQELGARRFKTPLPGNNGKGVNAYIIITEDEEGYPSEVFINAGKSGGDIYADAQAIGRLCSLILRNNGSVDSIHKQLTGIHSGSVRFTEDGQILSLPDAVSKVLETYMNQESISKILVEEKSKNSTDSCPDCGENLVTEEGCKKCSNLSCGFSRC